MPAGRPRACSRSRRRACPRWAWRRARARWAAAIIGRVSAARLAENLGASSRPAGSRIGPLLPPADPMTLRTGGEILVAALSAQGTTHAFGVPGESYLPVLDALHDVADRLRFVVWPQAGGG